MSNVPAGWYPSPEDPTLNRYWDGMQWTEHSAPALAVSAPVSPSAPSSPAFSAPAPGSAPSPGPAPANATIPVFPPPPGPVAAPAPASSASPQKKWLIGGAIAAGVIVVGSVGAAIGAGGDRDEAPQASTAPVVVETEEPAAAEPTPIATPTPSASVEAEVVDAVAFRAQAGSHLDDMNKDLDDIVVTVQEDGFWRLLSNSGELAFNLGQLEALDVPANVAVTWPESLVALDTSLDVLADAVSAQDGPTILAAVEAVRTQVETTRGVVDSAL